MGIEFTPENSSVPYTLTFSYGQKQLTASEYFHRILRETNPLTSLHDTPEITMLAIEQGRLAKGMTKSEALIARGYPPAHRTAGIESNEWVYYETPGFVDRVIFVDDKIATITRGPAPE